jgi:hypothetical protein
MGKNINSFFGVVLALSFLGAQGHAHPRVHTPEPGNPERQAIMDVMRLDFYRNDPEKTHRNPDRVFFKVYFLKVQGDWALTDVDPVDDVGKSIAEPRWGLLHRKAGRWEDVDYVAAVGDYESRHPGGTQLDDFDLLGMSDLAVRKLLLAAPEIPRDIFPRRQSRR